MNKYAKAMRSGWVFWAIALLSLMPTASARGFKDSEEVSGLLAQAKTEAVQLKQDTEEMNTFVRDKLSWHTHATQIDEIKRHVNNLGELVAKMNNAESTASPWQRQSIREVTPLLDALAETVTSTIDHLSANQDRLHSAPYPDYVSANADMASDLAQLVSDYVAYGEAKHKAEELSRKLELPRS
jgi:hypothetical protein